LAEHVWEAFDIEESLVAARNCFRFLKPGGYLRVAVPDGNHPNPLYIADVRPGGSGSGAEDHKFLYTHSTLSTVFESAGLKVNLLEYFDEDVDSTLWSGHPQTDLLNGLGDLTLGIVISHFLILRSFLMQ